jgi:hypothetical protein
MLISILDSMKQKLLIMNFVETPIAISDHTHGQVHLLDVIVEFFDICLLQESEMRLCIRFLLLYRETSLFQGF